MIARNQASWSCSVDRADQQFLITSHVINSKYEARVQLRMDIENMLINNVRWECYRTPAGLIFMSGEIPELIGYGVKTYSTKYYIHTLDPDISGIIAELISEGIRGVIQSQVYVINDAGGFISQEFIETWGPFFAGTCIRFGNLEQTAEHILDNLQAYSSSIKKESLFHRQKSYHIFTKPDGSLFATAGLADAHHEILLSVCIAENGQVTDITGNLLRVPNEECRKGLKPLSSLIDKNISNLTKKELADLVGGCCGCTHVLEICYDLGLTLAN